MPTPASKRVLQKTPIATLVKLEVPLGDLTLHNNGSRPAILMAGGLESLRFAASADAPRMKSYPIKSSSSMPTDGQKTLHFWRN